MFDKSRYIPPLASPISPASPISLLDAYEMADLILGTITVTADPSIVEEIAEQIVMHSTSGADFLNLNTTYIRKLSKDNDQVFKKLRELQNAQISPDIPVIPSSTTPSLTSIFSEGSSGRSNNIGNPGVIHHHTDHSVSSAVLGGGVGAQIPGNFSDEAWDFSDEDDLQTDLHTAIAETAVPQDDIKLPNHSLNLVASVNTALENGPPLASTLEQAIPITHTHTHTATSSTSDGATHVHSADESHNSELQRLPSGPINADDALIYGINESQLVINPSGSQSAGRLDEENTHLQKDSVLASPVFSTPSTRSSSPLSYLSYVDSDDELEDPDAHSEIHLDINLPTPHSTLDPDIPIEHETPLAPIISEPSSPTSEHLIQGFLDVSQLESSLSCSLNHPQTTRTILEPNILIEHDRPPIISIPSTLTDSWQIREDEALEPPCLPASEPLAEVHTMVDSWKILIEENEEALEPPPFASEPTASDTHFDVNGALNGETHETSQSLRSSNEEPENAIHEVDSPRCSNTGSMDRRDAIASNETCDSVESGQSSPQSSVSSSTLSLESSHDINDSNEQYTVDTATFRLPIDIIPMTPPGSPIFEGLSQYMIHDNVSTPVQRDIPTGDSEHTLRSSSEVLPFGLPTSSGNEQSLRNAQQETDPPESSGPNADVAQAIQPEPPYPHLLSLVQDSHLRRSTSPLGYVQSGILRFLPTIFALRKEMIDRTT